MALFHKRLPPANGTLPERVKALENQVRYLQETLEWAMDKLEDRVAHLERERGTGQ